MNRFEDMLCIRPIGVIHSPFKELSGMPIQPGGAKDVKGYIDLYDVYSEGLKDLGGFSHLILLYHFHKSQGYSLVVKPFLDTEPRGLFATRAPRRPNPIGISIVRLASVAENRVHIIDVDVLDGTPLFDIKPYVPCFDAKTEACSGWLEGKSGNASHTVSDGRFTTGSSQD